MSRYIRLEHAHPYDHGKYDNSGIFVPRGWPQTLCEVADVGSIALNRKCGVNVRCASQGSAQSELLASKMHTPAGTSAGAADGTRHKGTGTRLSLGDATTLAVRCHEDSYTLV
jgi:hypothetical protein